MSESGGSHGGEFTSAFGRAAEVHGRTAPAPFDAIDPQLTLADRKSRTAQVLTRSSPSDMLPRMTVIQWNSIN